MARRKECMFELHLIIWKSEDGVSKICEYIVKNPRNRFVKNTAIFWEMKIRELYTISVHYSCWSRQTINFKKDEKNAFLFQKFANISFEYSLHTPLAPGTRFRTTRILRRCLRLTGMRAHLTTTWRNSAHKARAPGNPPTHLSSLSKLSGE